MLDNPPPSTEAHVPRPQPWFEALLEAVVALVAPHAGVAGPLCGRWWPPGESPDDPAWMGWSATVYLAPGEAVGGRADGQRIHFGFDLDVRGVLALFSSLQEVSWSAPDGYNDPSAAPGLTVAGHFLDRELRLRLLQAPPAGEPPAVAVSHGQVRPWGAGDPGAAGV